MLQERHARTPDPVLDKDLRRRWLSRDRGTLVALHRVMGLDPPAWLSYTADVEELAAWGDRTYADAAARLVSSGRDADRDAGLAEAVTACDLYFIALQAWENTDEYEAIAAYISRASDWLGGKAWPGQAVPAVIGLMRSLIPQMLTEDARFCACPVSMKRAATDAVTALVEVNLGDSGSGTGRSCLDLLVAVLRRDRDNDAEYYGLLATTIAPLATTFAERLVEAPDGRLVDGVEAWRHTLRRDIDAQLPVLRRSAQRFIDSGEVFGGELRAQCNALESVRNSLGRATLLLERGRLVIVYPFGLELSHDWATQLDGGGVAGQEVTVRLAGRDHEVDVALGFEGVDRTDAWSMLTRQDVDLQDIGALRLLPPRSLLLRPSWALKEDPDYHHPLDFMVLLGAGGKHYVRIETPLGRLAGPPGAAEDDRLPWSGHDVDQWVRRLTRDAGRETVEVIDGAGVAASYASIYDLALDVIRAVHDVDRRLAGETGGVAPEDGHERGLVRATIVFVVEDASVVTPGGVHRRLAVDDDLAGLNGFQSLTTGHRYLPAAVEEWVGFEVGPGPDLLKGVGVRGDSLFVNGEVVTLFARSSPNWLVIEQLEIIEFAIGIRAQMATLSDRLRVDRRSAPDLDAATRRQREQALESQIAGLGRQLDDGHDLLELIRSRELVRSPYHREFLDRVLHALGQERMEQHVMTTLLALEEHRAGLSEERRHADSMRLDRRVEYLTVVALFIGIYQGMSAVIDPASAWGDVAVAGLSVGVTVLLAVLYNVFRGRRP